MFLQWMKCNAQYPKARQLRYFEFLGKYVWNKDNREWCPPKKGFSIGRMYHAYPGSGERYHMRTLLNYVKGPTCHEDIRTVFGILYPTFKDACFAMGLLDDHKEYADGITEASFWATAQYLRKFFAILLMSNSISRPKFVWNETWKFLSEDILYRQRKIIRLHDLRLTEIQLKNYTLVEIEHILQNNGETIENFSNELCPDALLVRDGSNKFILEELRYDRQTMHLEHETLDPCLTDEQKVIYDDIMNAISLDKGGVYFLYGHGGTGKTFMWRTLCAVIRSRGKIVLLVASSGIASLLLPMGRTAHSRFGIPLDVNEETMCRGIQPGTALAELLQKTKLIIWDEAPMMKKHCFEALDRSMRDTIRGPDGRPVDLPFGCKVVVLGGDFRQILPVIAKGTRQDVVSATLNSSYLWHTCKVLRLTKNMRLQSNFSDTEEIHEFANWIL
ncbi:unnamed protein product, partial [Amaranthus hypochondriacus]